ncbi:hypothetical protein BKA65DRAFT_540422 [Rhexocercosporidium sp. MPI-PUGE-AT-0058]|nr:hypothetical protein BKA65DRAFT_540422 [Rhexocercosporidium sp. MPI-PUGE-AT-0058]
MSKTEKGICPVGGDWYTCTAQSPTFFGCCTSNPCRGDNTGCPASGLRAAGIGSGTNADGTVNGTYWPNTQCTKGQWWTCDVPQEPTFQGCCDVNPCNGVGCPAGSLQQAAFRTVPATTATSSSATQRPSSSPNTNSSGDSNPNIGAIAGGVAGGVVILIVGLVILWMCRRRRQKNPTMPSSSLEGSNGGFKSPAGVSGQSQTKESKAHKSTRYSLLGIPLSLKYLPASMSSPPVSPGPPPYQTPQQSQNPNIHEIDSTHLHEVEGMLHSSAAVQALHSRPISHELESPIVHSAHRSGERLEELLTSAGDDRWSSRKSTVIASVEIGDGSPGSNANPPVSTLLGSNAGGRDGRGSHYNPRSSTLTPVSRTESSHASNNRPEGIDSYVSWQSIS